MVRRDAKPNRGSRPVEAMKGDQSGFKAMRWGGWYGGLAGNDTGNSGQ